MCFIFHYFSNKIQFVESFKWDKIVIDNRMWQHPKKRDIMPKEYLLHFDGFKSIEYSSFKCNLQHISIVSIK